MLVFDEKIIGSYDTYERAAEEGVSSLGMEANFLVYQIIENEPLNFVMEAAL